ncbi:hypothetical protein, partial [Escherichia coli]
CMELDFLLNSLPGKCLITLR